MTTEQSWQKDRFASVRGYVRRLLSIAPKIGSVPMPPTYRPAGLSVMMTVKDEEDWVGLALQSVATIADEIVVVDNGSTDRTPEIVSRTVERYNLPARILSYNSDDFAGAVNYTYLNTTRRWVLRWHGDFVGHTNGPYSLTHLRRRLESLDVSRYFCIYLRGTSLDGDLFHQQDPDVAVPEPFIFTFSPLLHYHQFGLYEKLVVPYFYGKLEWLEPYFFHVRSVKPAGRLLRRRWWAAWLADPHRLTFPTLTEYIKHKVKTEWGLDDLSEAACYFVNQSCRAFVRYDESRSGPYPELLKEELRDPKYRIVYDGDRIIGRSDTLKM